MTPQQQIILTAVRGCIGTPFRHQGRCPGLGIDCAGVVLVAARALGVEYHDVRGYHTQPYRGQLRAAIESHACVKRVATPEPGDILLLRIRREPQHLAIYAGDSIVHAYATVGRVIEERLSQFWQSRIVAMYRFVQ